MAHHDILIRQAMLIDGTGNAAYKADLAVRGGWISAMGTLSADSAGSVIDADGLVLAPGFIDSHCHDDLALLEMPLLEPKVSQGVTTVINGNCGISLAPQLPGRPPAPPPLTLFRQDSSQAFASFGEYFRALDEAPAAVNHACLCGHSNLRHAVMDALDRPAHEDEIGRMNALLEAALADGVLGLSTGLFYATARAASTEEVIAITRTLARHGGIYVTHMRDEEHHVTESVQETLRIGREAMVPVIVSHHKCIGEPNHGKSRITLAMIEQARQTQSVGLDAYPYDASSTILIPSRVTQCDRVMITWSEPMPDACGRDLADIALEMGCGLVQAAERLVPGGAVYFQMDEADVRRILAYPQTMIGSDGIVSDTHPHPRAWGTFSRVLGHYSRDEKLFSLEQAVHKMTGLTAATFGLEQRGTLAPGHHADLVLFDPDRIADLATFAQPCQPSAGIEQVFNNGVCIWKDGGPTGCRPGRTLRRATTSFG